MSAEAARDRGDRIELRIRGAAAQAVVAPILTAMGARAGLTVQQLDELEMATELLLRGCTAAPVTVVMERELDELRISVSPLAERWAQRRSGILGELAGRVAVEGDRAELRAGR